MTLKDIEREAVALPVNERADLICKLLDTLPPAHGDVSDEEAAKRALELKTGEVEALSQDEFVRRVQRARHRDCR